MKKILLVVAMTLVVGASDFYYEYGKKVMITKSYESRGNSSIKYYQNSLGKKIGVDDKIILKCKVDRVCEESLKKYNIKEIERLSDTLYLVTIAPKEDIFKLSQELYRDESIEFAHPNFIKERKRR
jgi:hypothetical protein